MSEGTAENKKALVQSPALHGALSCLPGAVRRQLRRVGSRGVLSDMGFPCSAAGSLQAKMAEGRF